MYELIKDLREKAEFLTAAEPLNIKNAFAETMKQAADAIEELQQTVEQMKAIVIVEAQHTEMFDERDKKTLMEMVKSLPLQIIPHKDEKPRWIPVTDRLPEDDCHVLAYYGFNHGNGYLGMMFMQVLDYYARDPRPHFQHEGLNGMTVTHWMPLPEPSKEE